MAALLAELEDDEDDSLPAWSRTYAGYRERFVNSFSLSLQERTLVLEQAPCVSADHARESKASADGSCTASTVWDAGIVLAAHVFAECRKAASKSTAPEEEAQRLLDLGSGTGIVGLAAAASGSFSSVVLTDLPSVVPLLERNAAANAAEIGLATSVEALPLSWDDDGMLQSAAARGPFTMIVGGDLLYRPQVVPPLLHAIQALAVPATTVLLAASLQHSPETIRLFAREAQAAGFQVERLGADAICTTDWLSPEVRILRLRWAPKKKAKTKSSSKKRPRGSSCMASPD